jgi:GGDEF domain-containing protein
VSPLRAAQERIEHLSSMTHDRAGQPHRPVRGLEAMAGDPAGGALLLVDLDHLKSPTSATATRRRRDAAGRGAAAARGPFAPSDLVARLGGDEFAVLAFGVGAEGAMAVRSGSAPRSRSRSGMTGWSWASRAASASPARRSTGSTRRRCSRAADLAAFEAKAQGRDSARLFDPALSASAARPAPTCARPSPRR